MRHGSSAGQALFPLVILAVKDNSSAVLNMEKLRQSVPLNMFLPWVTQLISHLRHSPAIEQLLLDITEEYPTHVQLPFAITKKLLNRESIDSKNGHFSVTSLIDYFIELTASLHSIQMPLKNWNRNYPSIRHGIISWTASITCCLPKGRHVSYWMP